MSFWGHSVRFLKTACMLKRDGRGAKRSEIWDSGTIVINIWGTFELVGFMVIWGLFRLRALVSELPVTQKRLVVGWKGVKVLDLGTLVTHIWVSIVYFYYIPCLTKGIFWQSNVKIRISHFSYIPIATTWVLGINLTCSPPPQSDNWPSRSPRPLGLL